ncbi:MAG: O-antigen ligase family protein [Thermoleophilaceae bacterium]
MAATTTRRPSRAPRPAARVLGRLTGLGGAPPAAALLGLGLAVAAIYAAFAHGSIGIPEESRLQVGVAAIAFFALAGLLYGSGLSLRAPTGAKWGVALLVGFAAWAALSISWSVAPDESWLEANRALSYALVVGLGIALGSSLPRAAERAGVGFLAVATLIALYALGGKLFPWLHIGGLIDLNHTERFSRLRAPLDYWNALGLVCVVAAPIAMRVGAEARYRVRARLAGVASLVLVLTTLALTYSRGGLLVLVAAVALTIALGPDRLRLAALFAAGIVGAVPPVLVALVRDSLTTDGLPVSERSGDGLIFLAGLLLGLAVAIVLGRLAIKAGDRLQLGPRGRRRARLGAMVGGVGLVAIVLGALALSDRGIGGTISHRAEEFTKPKLDRQNDPARVLRTNSGNRWVWWEEAVGGWSDRPLAGYGAGSFPTTHLAYRTNVIEVRQPHSVPLEFLTETGLVGALLALGGLALLCVAATRNLLARPHGPERAFAVALLAGVLAWVLHGWVDWDWDIPGVTLPVLALLGVLAARPRTEGAITAAERPRAGRSRGLKLAAGGAAACVLIALAALPALAQSLTDSALTRAAGNTPSGLRAGEEKAALAKRLNPFSVAPVFAQAAIAERGNQPDAAAGLLVEAVDRQPDNPQTWTRLLRFQVLVNDST